MSPKKINRKRKLRKKNLNDLNPEELLAKRLKKEESLKKRELMVQEMKEILDRRAADRAAKKNAIRDERIKLYQTEIRNKNKSIQEKKMIQIRKDMKSILVAGVEKVNALRVIGEKVKLNGNIMIIGNSKYKLKNNVHMVGWGRETLMLGASFEKLIGKHLKKGFLVIPRGSISGMWDKPLWFPALNTRITFLEAGSSGSVDDQSVTATRRIADYCKKLKKADILVVILSGGTKDLLSCPKGGITLKEFEDVVLRLQHAGASPVEMNIVKCKLSAVFGGELARLAYPAKVITLVMSDIPEDPPLLIAGAPTVNNPNRDAASAVLKKYNLENDLPPSVVAVLDEKLPAKDRLVDENKNFKFVDYRVVASTADAVQEMANAAFSLGLVPVILSSTISGPVREVSQAYTQLAALMILAAEEKINKIEMYDAMKFNPVLPLSEEKVKEIFPSKEKWGLGLCLLLGGSPAVNIIGENMTGANQELALYFSLDWYLKVKENPILNSYVVWFLGGSTCGVDGNSQAAGAYGYGNLGPAIFKRYKELTEEEAQLSLKVPGLLRNDPESKDTQEALEKQSSLREEISKISKILPDRVLKEGNANFMFTNINDGDELLNLGYTYTSVCDLHVIRIVRFQCNCDGNCLGRGEEKMQFKNICQDVKCVANRKLPVVTMPPKTQCCARIAKPKIKIY